MPTFSVIEDLCRKDGICSSVCPARVIKGAKGALPFMRPGREESCIACGHCIAFCPHDAVRIDVLPAEERAVIKRPLLPSPESAELFIKSRRSVRRFKPEPLSRETITELLHTARYAPSAKNRQPVRWIVVHDREKLTQIGNIAADWLTQSPEAQSVVEEAKALARAQRSGLDPLLRGAPHVVLAVTPKSWSWGAVDAAIALTYLETAAHAQGLGCCWAGYLVHAAEHCKELREALGVQEHEAVVGGQAVGKIALRPTAVPPRRKADIEWL